MAIRIIGLEKVRRDLLKMANKQQLKKIVQPAARATLRQVVLPEARRNNERTIDRRLGKIHPRTLARHNGAFRGKVGPSSRFLRVGNIKSRGSRLVGGKIEYRESGIFKRVSYKPFVIEKQVRGDRFERSGKRTARIFYPAAQEYGAANAKPPIKAKRQMKRATDSKRISAQRVFRGKFVRSFRKFASEIGFF